MHAYYLFIKYVLHAARYSTYIRNNLINIAYKWKVFVMR